MNGMNHIKIAEVFDVPLHNGDGSQGDQVL